MLKRAALHSRRRRFLLFLILVASTLLVTLQCRAPRPTEEPETGPTLSIVCRSREGAEGLGAGAPLPTERFLIQNQVIVIGPEDAVNSVVDELGEDVIDPNPLRDCTLAGLDVSQEKPREELDPEFYPFPPELTERLVLRLYQVAEGVSAGGAVQAINQAGNDRNVFADPNYLIGLLGQSACGNPYSVAGSPYSVAGSPYSVAGSPAGGGPRPADLFWGQWAFEQIGVSAPTAQMRPRVRVGVFDTAPFMPSSQESVPDAEGVVHFSRPITAITPTLALQLSYPPIAMLTSPLTGTVEDHGLFVAGLVHAVAPGSEIHLIRVLDDHGCGSLFTLAEALFRFVSQMQTGGDGLMGVVINLSLGVHQPEGDPEDPDELARLYTREQVAQILRSSEAKDWSILVNDSIESLRAAVYIATYHGALVVAAAGNDSYASASPLPAQIPARYRPVLGVAANNQNKQISCFSNEGDIKAPGGDGGPDGTHPCVPQVGMCTGDCAYAVVSLAQSSPTSYAYWSGSSFSAPLTSGLAARVFDAGAAGGGRLSPGQVMGAIDCGAPPSDDVISVGDTLSGCVP